MKSVAIVGTGIMGSGMAVNFLKKGHQVFVWNRTKSKLKPLINRGAIATSSPKEATSKAAIIFDVTANNQSSQSVWLGPRGILAGANSTKCLIANGTFSAAWIDKLAKICQKKKLTFFDMPMTGGRIGAETGAMILLVGSKKQKLKTIYKDLNSIAKRIVYLGKTGSGIRFKLILNMIQSAHIVAFGEALKLAKKTGLNLKVVGDYLSLQPGGVVTNLAWRDYQKEPKPINFSIKWIAKDLKYAKQLAKNLPLPILDQTYKAYLKAVKQKHGRKDWTAINKI